MDTSGFSPHIFWSYDPSADIPQEVVIKQVVLYGEIRDKVLLVKKVGKEKIRRVMENWKNEKGAEKHICFMQRVILA
jgi:hypothetical protein